MSPFSLESPVSSPIPFSDSESDSGSSPDTSMDIVRDDSDDESEFKTEADFDAECRHFILDWCRFTAAEFSEEEEVDNLLCVQESESASVVKEKEEEEKGASEADTTVVKEESGIKMEEGDGHFDVEMEEGQSDVKLEDEGAKAEGRGGPTFWERMLMEDARADAAQARADARRAACLCCARRADGDGENVEQPWHALHLAREEERTRTRGAMYLDSAWGPEF